MAPGTLTIKPQVGKLTYDTEVFGKMDPFVQIKIGQQVFKTQPSHDSGLNPSWNQAFTARLMTEDMIYFQIYDYDVGSSNDFVCEGSYSLYAVFKGGKHSEWVPLNRKGKPAGQILFEFEFYPDGGQKPGKEGKGLDPNQLVGGQQQFQQPNQQLFQQPNIQQFQQPNQQQFQQPNQQQFQQPNQQYQQPNQQQQFYQPNQQQQYQQPNQYPQMNQPYQQPNQQQQPQQYQQNQQPYQPPNQQQNPQQFNQQPINPMMGMQQQGMNPIQHQGQFGQQQPFNQPQQGQNFQYGNHQIPHIQADPHCKKCHGTGFKEKKGKRKPCGKCYEKRGYCKKCFGTRWDEKKGHACKKCK